MWNLGVAKEERCQGEVEIKRETEDRGLLRKCGRNTKKSADENIRGFVEILLASQNLETKIKIAGSVCVMRMC